MGEPEQRPGKDRQHKGIDNVTSEIVGDQAIDFEPTGSVDLSDITIVNSQLARGADSQGGYTVSPGGDGPATAKRITLAHTTIADGGVHVIDTEDVTIEDVIIEGKEEAASTPVLHVRKRTVGMQILDTHVRRPLAMGAGAVLKIHHQSGSAPSDVRLDNVVLEQNTTAVIVDITSLGRFTMQDSTHPIGQASSRAPQPRTSPTMACGSRTACRVCRRSSRTTTSAAPTPFSPEHFPGALD